MKDILVGSKLLNLSNQHDLDLITFYTEDKYNMINVNNLKDEIDHKYMLLDTKINSLLFKDNNFIRIFNYQFDSIINKEFSTLFEYHILDYKKELVKLLKWIVDNKKYNFNKNVYAEDKKCTKLIYHIAYNLFIIENNSPIITKEQKETIQKIHDLEMPIDYLDELEIKINNLQLTN